jgi:hypothetical protein
VGTLIRIAGYGHAEGAEEDPFVFVAPSPLDYPLIAGPVDQDRLEDLQIWAALSALGMNGIVSHHPLDVRHGEDPPDRWLVNGNRQWATELTELTIKHVRKDLDQVRWFGRQLRERVLAYASAYSHLKGRMVSLSAMPDRSMPKNLEPLLTDLEQVLAQDRGFVGEDVDTSEGFPTQFGRRGFYGIHGPFIVVANPASGSDDILVSANAQSKIYRSEAIAALGNRVAEKDKPGNEVLIVTCGLPDKKGYTCPIDQSIFSLLAESEQDILPQPLVHIRGILIHLWNTHLCILRGTEDLPWTLPATS